LLEIQTVLSKKARERLMNKTLAYTFKGEVKDVEKINQIDQVRTDRCNRFHESLSIKLFNLENNV